MANSLEILKEKGYRITQTRKQIFNIFEKSAKPLSVSELLKGLKDKNLSVHKTTVYRALEAMVHESILYEIYFADGVIYYELKNQKHHHHLVCIKCKKVEDMFVEYPMGKVEKAIYKKTGFKTIHHSLEFFGLCKKCL